MTTKNNTNTGLLILGITSLIAVGTTALYDIMLFMLNSVSDEVLGQAIQQSRDNIVQMGFNNTDEVDFNIMYRMIDNALFHLLFNIVEAVGIILLFTKYKVGIHFYIASQIGFAYLAYATFGQSSIMQILLCIVWTWLYWRTTQKALS